MLQVCGLGSIFWSLFASVGSTVDLWTSGIRFSESVDQTTPKSIIKLTGQEKVANEIFWWLILSQMSRFRVFFSDDQGYSDVPWKSSKVKMPHLDALRRRGMTIDGAYSQARCSPSRVALMTGKYPWKIGVLTGVFQLLGKAGVRKGMDLLFNPFAC